MLDVKERNVQDPRNRRRLIVLSHRCSFFINRLPSEWLFKILSTSDLLELYFLYALWLNVKFVPPDPFDFLRSLSTSCSYVFPLPFGPGSFSSSMVSIRFTKYGLYSMACLSIKFLSLTLLKQGLVSFPVRSCSIIVSKWESEYYELYNCSHVLGEVGTIKSLKTWDPNFEFNPKFFVFLLGFEHRVHRVLHQIQMLEIGELISIITGLLTLVDIAERMPSRLRS